MIRRIAAQVIAIGEIRFAGASRRILRLVLGAATILVSCTVESRAATNLTTDELSTVSGYEFSPDGQWVVFSTYTHEEGERTYSRPLHGTHVPFLLHDTGPGRSGDFVISPDSHWVVMHNHTRPIVSDAHLITRRIDGSAPINNLTSDIGVTAYDASRRLLAYGCRCIPCSRGICQMRLCNGGEIELMRC